MESFSFIDWGKIDYEEGFERQTMLFNALIEAKIKGNPSVNQLIFCEHNPVFTIGKSGKENNLLVPEEILKQRGATYYHTNRGGDITYHGPGQITGYPIFDLEYWGLGLKQYIHLMEEVVIRFLNLYGIPAERLDGATGVWLEANKKTARKICAIGVKSSRYVTMHGFALNINTDLSFYSLINPCGFVDKGVTSLAKELGEPQDFDLAKERLKMLFRELFP
ncbi:lipoyl(octanoyl) transferase LipB [Massilibacteroides sp.]|uniref:lipoyl(octanoyl) transferase LipB n=1 Tax=Massilibacteroides sp. TaxID=2034766 RepID=UPI00260E5D1F|nr:lipoyl(octanoyl) transferase LipB [Massilibacteroides sp.]MDD4515613.1 lipoyl(octanoyl) transferase LipB [Massilibacteroides sp.]